LILPWLRRRRERRLLAKPFPAEWNDAIAEHVWQDACLPDADRRLLRDRIRLFLDDKNLEGCGGLVLDDTIRVAVAAYACLPALRLGPDCYERVESVLIYPDAYRAPTERQDGAFVHAGVEDRAGESSWTGAVVVSWGDLVDRSPGSNVVIHEFAHELDRLNGTVDGLPPLEDADLIPVWRERMQRAFDRHRAAVQLGRHSLIPRYGATDLAEFFAVLSELYFESPRRLRAARRAIYDILRSYYILDPATWETPR
jgi:hypothetical protein